MAKEMFDLALLSSNANQLRYIMDLINHDLYFWISVVLLSISITAQAAVAIALVFKRRHVSRNGKHNKKSENLDHFIMIQIILILVSNVLSSAFAPHTS